MGRFSKLSKANSDSVSKVFFRFIKGKYSGGEFSIKEGRKLIIGRDISSDVAIVDTKVRKEFFKVISVDQRC